MQLFNQGDVLRYDLNTTPEQAVRHCTFLTKLLFGLLEVKRSYDHLTKLIFGSPEIKNGYVFLKVVRSYRDALFCTVHNDHLCSIDAQYFTNAEEYIFPESSWVNMSLVTGVGQTAGRIEPNQVYRYVPELIKGRLDERYDSRTGYRILKSDVDNKKLYFLVAGIGPGFVLCEVYLDADCRTLSKTFFGVDNPAYFPASIWFKNDESIMAFVGDLASIRRGINRDNAAPLS